MTFAYGLALFRGCFSAGPADATRSPARSRGIGQRCQTHRVRPQKTGQGPKERLLQPLPQSLLLSCQQGRSWRARELHLGMLSAQLAPWAAPGCHGRAGKAPRRRLSRAVLQQRRAKPGDSRVSGCVSHALRNHAFLGCKLHLPVRGEDEAAEELRLTWEKPRGAESCERVKQ